LYCATSEKVLATPVILTVPEEPLLMVKVVEGAYAAKSAVFPSVIAPRVTAK